MSLGVIRRETLPWPPNKRILGVDAMLKSFLAELVGGEIYRLTDFSNEKEGIKGEEGREKRTGDDARNKLGPTFHSKLKLITSPYPVINRIMPP